MLWTIIGILLVLWLAGVFLHLAGGLIHLLLVVAIVVAAARLLTGRTTTPRPLSDDLG